MVLLDVIVLDRGGGDGSYGGGILKQGGAGFELSFMRKFQVSCEEQRVWRWIEVLGCVLKGESVEFDDGLNVGNREELRLILIRLRVVL